MPNRARPLKATEAAGSRSRHTVRCSVCEGYIETGKHGTSEVMIRCPHCGTLQHRRVGKESKKRRRER